MSVGAVTVMAGRIVVPHAGTWIEISLNIANAFCVSVVPHAGTWIEICHPCPELL